MAETFFDRVNKNKTLHTPDVLSCLANLSNDEVFTPPEVVTKMLDMLPQELFQNPETTFLDPACKTGVFLREIAKRLIVGLEDKIPDLQQRIDHIFHKQLFGVAITELTSLLSRRSVYCSKYPDGRYSVSHFESTEGNIRFKKGKHTWVGGKCKYCGASKSEYDRASDLETHAYEFIHVKPEEIFNMKFDVIISNPPYQLSDGGAQASAKPIYHLFVQQAKKLAPRYLTFIIPSRWMTGGKGLDEFRNEMMHDTHITVLHDFINSSDCFTGVDITGGVCFFLREKDNPRKCHIFTHNADNVQESNRYLCEHGDDIFIRDNRMISIKNKVNVQPNDSFMNIVSARKPYGLSSDFFKNPGKYDLPQVSNEPIDGGYSILGLENLKRTKKYIPKNYPIPKTTGLYKYKIFISNSYGCSAIGEDSATPVLAMPFLAMPGEICTETFLEIGNFDSLEQAANCMSYIKTKFFRLLVGIRKMTQHATKEVYKYVPMQDFSKPWTDKELYAKYNLTQEEIDYIESVITPMDNLIGGNE